MERVIFGTEMDVALHPQGKLSYNSLVQRIFEGTHAFGISTRPVSAFGAMVNGRRFLFNGGCIYIDQGQLEIDTAECKYLDDLIIQQRALAKILGIITSMRDAHDSQEKNRAPSVWITMNNTDWKYKNKDGFSGHLLNTFGTHENYSLDIDDGKMRFLLPFLATRQVFSGSGCFMPQEVSKDFKTDFVLSARATCATVHEGKLVIMRVNRDTEIVGSKAKRLHIVCGDSQRSSFQQKLTIGTTALVGKLVSEGDLAHSRYAKYLEFSQEEIAGMFKNIAKSGDYGRWQIPGKNISALDIQRIYFLEAEKKFRSSSDPDTQWVLLHWHKVLNALAKNWASLVGLDWVAKRRLVDMFHLSPKECQNMEIVYHMLGGLESSVLLAKVGVKEEITNTQIIRTTNYPPRETRAEGRSIALRAIARYINKNKAENPIVEIDWDKIKFLDVDFNMDDPHNTYVPQALMFESDVERLPKEGRQGRSKEKEV